MMMKGSQNHRYNPLGGTLRDALLRLLRSPSFDVFRRAVDMPRPIPSAIS
jgi:hypothetical protein